MHQIIIPTKKKNLVQTASYAFGDIILHRFLNVCMVRGNEDNSHQLPTMWPDMAHSGEAHVIAVGGLSHMTVHADMNAWLLSLPT